MPLPWRSFGYSERVRVLLVLDFSNRSIARASDVTGANIAMDGAA